VTDRAVIRAFAPAAHGEVPFPATASPSKRATSSRGEPCLRVRQLNSDWKRFRQLSDTGAVEHCAYRAAVATRVSVPQGTVPQRVGAASVRETNKARRLCGNEL
jgi:hypothetical protein